MHIDIPHGFNVGAAKQPQGCKNSHHSHDTAEVFFVHQGEWKFTWGHDGSDGELVIGEGTTISIPTQVFRGFENVGADNGFLFAVLGIDEDGTPGNVTWAPYVFDNAKLHGLVLLEDGRLIDTVADEVVPEDANVVQAPTLLELKNYRRMSLQDMRGCVQSETELMDTDSGGLGCCDGVEEKPVLGVANSTENITAGKMWWAHGFQLRHLRLESAAEVPAHIRQEEEVLFIHRGELHIRAAKAQFTLQQGDLFTVPIGMVRHFNNNASTSADIIVIRGGDYPQAAQFK